MQLKWMHKLIFGGFAAVLMVMPVALLLLPQQAESTTELMTALPSFNKYKCANCHATAKPDATHYDLNSFGNDFLANGKVWNKALANMNSDNDKCSNGFELGDVNGDGVYDQGGEVLENSNPGNGADCTISLSQGT